MELAGASEKRREQELVGADAGEEQLPGQPGRESSEPPTAWRNSPTNSAVSRANSAVATELRG
jgi:hypothetical protein